MAPASWRRRSESLICSDNHTGTLDVVHIDLLCPASRAAATIPRQASRNGARQRQPVPAGTVLGARQGPAVVRAPAVASTCQASRSRPATPRWRRATSWSAPVQGEPVDHLGPERARADLARHQVGCVEPEDRLRCRRAPTRPACRSPSRGSRRPDRCSPTPSRRASVTRAFSLAHSVAGQEGLEGLRPRDGRRRPRRTRRHREPAGSRGRSAAGRRRRRRRPRPTLVPSRPVGSGRSSPGGACSRCRRGSGSRRRSTASWRSTARRR